MSPVFTIAIPTYNRVDLLRQTVLSIINQTFSNFEIIISNDFIEKKLTQEKLDIFDDRIKIYNNIKNLGEIKNMNYLLSLANGKYFAWQFDDDIYALNFLETINNTFKREEDLNAVFSSYKFFYGTNNLILKTRGIIKNPHSFSGAL